MAVTKLSVFSIVLTVGVISFSMSTVFKKSSKLFKLTPPS
nr:MAG TPA: hypothetical protein [Caudoviricetes sp.]DAH47646.1 MAG TPA: hypothetical protein [Caudoviricetes sp.]DAK97307.1 MAG TPA: hypothetical protein [Caudoviricetes sp.]DAT46860.1 MAG TPA: hypothetical protein [Caudoviricetes sp.]DAV20362.1 MAG TPA: hypothetical protein [Caudoviricetes sp.]